MIDYKEFEKYTLIKDEKNPFSKKYLTEDNDVFYVEPVFYTMLMSFKEHHKDSIDLILKEMERVVKKNHKVVFTGNFESPFTIVDDDFVILEIFDITDKLNIFVEDKSRGSDYGD